MSRSTHQQRQQQKLQLQQQQQQQQQLLAQQQQMADNEAAAVAAEMFDLFCVATTMRQILGLHRNMCDAVGLRPAPLNDFYPKLKAKIRSWKAQALWKKFDARAAHRVYAKGTACAGTRVLVIGAGPCGLRTAIEAQLLGAKVVVVEMRDRISRNNVLHLWPFVITDLRNLGAKKFYGKFCAGSIDHISIRQLQCILLKVALLLGVEIHEGVSFEHSLEPSGDGCGWRASVSPSDHVVSHYEFDVLIGADGKRNTLEGFKRKEFRGKLAIAITANFINKKTEAEAKAEEISGVAFIFNQSFFKELYHTTGIDLENIVYYKDETHYFVMTAKKHSLIDKGVIMQDFADPAELLAGANVNTEKLLNYAREAAEFSTKYQMPNLEFAVNHYGKPDVAMFDFTSMFAAETSCRVIMRKGFRLLQCLVGDSLLEPFWPTGSGCARGFLSSMDAAYAIKLWSNARNSTLGVLAQRESIYRLLNQTTPENLHRDIGSYTVDPATRYPNLNRTSVNVWQVKHLISTDDNSILEQTFMDTNATTQVDTPVRRKRRSGDTQPLSTVLLRWICAQLHAYEFSKDLKEASDIFTQGKVLCALINRYRPDLVDFNAVKDLPAIECNELAFKILDKELHIPRIMSAKDSVQLSVVESKIWLQYLEQICEVFRGEIPHVKHPKMDFSDLREKYRINYSRPQPDFSKLLQMSKNKTRTPMQDMVDEPVQVQRRSVLDEDKVKRQRAAGAAAVGAPSAVAGASGLQAQTDTPRRAKKRRSAEKSNNISSKVALAFKKQAASEKCHFCKQTVYLMEKITAENLILHRSCLKCYHCHTNLRPGGYAFDRDDPNGHFYCTQHYRLPAKAIRPVVRKPGQRKPTQQQQAAAAAAAAAAATTTENAAVHKAEGDDTKTPEKLRVHIDNVAQLDLLDRGQTPERIEFANTDAMSDGEPSEEHIIDEHEWSGRNFLPESNNDSHSDISSSDDSNSDSDSEMFEEANDSPLGVQTIQIANDWIGKQKYSDSDDSDDFYDSSDGAVDDGKDDTEGEEFKKARELRREEVRLLPLPANLPTDTETEVQTDSESSSDEKNELNSATEISTDSEFDHDERKRETPKIFIDDTHLRKPTKVQVKSTVITPSTGNKFNAHATNNSGTNKGGSYLQKYQQTPPMPQFKPLVQVDPSLLISNRVPLKNPNPGDYLLNKTASTEGIASKKSLELKKRYLLGEPSNGNKIQKSGSTSVLDSRIRTFNSNISECQKLLNPSSDISPSMKTFLDRTKLGESSKSNDLMRSATTNIINDLKVEITVQKASSTASTDNEKENVFVNSKNELNKGMEYSETINTTLMDSMSKKSPSTPTNNHQTIIESIDLVTPEKVENVTIIDLTKDEVMETKSSDKLQDSNKIIELTGSTDGTPLKNDKIILAAVKPDVSKDAKQIIPDILGHIKTSKVTTQMSVTLTSEDQQKLLGDEDEKRDSPEKMEDQYEHESLQIQVPDIPWNTRRRKSEQMSTTTTGSTCSSNSSSIEDIGHYILESTTSPDTQTGAAHQVPRVEIHDTSGTLMQIDSLMIIDGKYVGDPEDLKYMEIPEGIIIPQAAAVKTNELEDEVDIEPVTATPEPVECTVIEATDEQPPPLPEQGPPLPERGPPKFIPSNLKFDTKNENKLESLKNLPLILEASLMEENKAVKPNSLNLGSVVKSPASAASSPMVDNDKTPTADLLSRGSDSETEQTGTGHVFTETELSDWTADDCISENFVDMEYGLKSQNMGTIKRNKKSSRKSTKIPSSSEMMYGIKAANPAPVTTFEGILKCIDVDDIEFMDTGSEGSCAEAYSATNTALLQNRGYVEFVEPKITREAVTVPTVVSGGGDNKSKLPVAAKRNEKLGVDYIEQGAYIMHESPEADELLKTPVNEAHPSINSSEQKHNIMTQSLTDSSTLNDLDDDSSQAAVITKTTTEESEALTVVTSPLDSSSPRTPVYARGPLAAVLRKGPSETTANSTPSSSEKQPKTSQSTWTASSGSTTNSSSKSTPPPLGSTRPHSSQDSEKVSQHERQPSEELSYEEYVRALQQKITQISTARDSLENRKQRRKSSKGEAPAGMLLVSASPASVQTVIEQQQPSMGTTTAAKLHLGALEAPASTAHTAAHQHKVPEIPTLTSKLEEITKERTKQKDLIHDLVMDKLQSKKQLNAEKRLHRSRQRSMVTSGYASGSSLSPTPKLAATSDTNCSNQAHYHVSTAAAAPLSPSNYKENKPLSTPVAVPSYKPAYNTDAIARSPNKSTAATYKQRPFSEHLDAEQLDALERYKLSKTPSFPYVLTTSTSSLAKPHSAFATPTAAVRQQNKTNTEEALHTSTENLRSEARARARLKSNTELGISPEEKLKLLRNRHFVDNKSKDHATAKESATEVERKILARVRKMSASKSVNDLAYISATKQRQEADENSNTKADFTSDPNLLLSAAAAASGTKAATLKPASNKTARRVKDPERRKSLIQSLSSFFKSSSNSSSSQATTNAASDAHKKKENNIQPTTGVGPSVVNAERPGTSGSSHSGSADGGMFSRFRISPKSKEKSKDKDAVGGHSKAKERSYSQESIPRTHHTASSSNNANHTTSHSHNHRLNLSSHQLNHHQSKYQNTTNHNTNKNTKKPSSSSSCAFSSSSPQLHVANNKSCSYLAADEQIPPPIPPLPLNYQRSDDESYATENRDQKKQRAISKAVRQAELKRLRIAQEIQREQEEIEVQLKELEARGVLIEKALRGENQQVENHEPNTNNDESLLKELLEIWRKITQLKKRDEELGIRQQELQLEHRHAQLKEELNLRLSCNKLDKSSADVAAEGAILNEMLEIVARRASLRPTSSNSNLAASTSDLMASTSAAAASGIMGAASTTQQGNSITLGQSHSNNESNI